jgi:hypothetical protein
MIIRGSHHKRLYRRQPNVITRHIGLQRTKRQSPVLGNELMRGAATILGGGVVMRVGVPRAPALFVCHQVAASESVCRCGAE